MKKILGLILTLCLVLVLAADAFAAGKPAITKQPESATTSKKGTVSFSVKTSGAIQSLTWYFVDPVSDQCFESQRKENYAEKGPGIHAWLDCLLSFER